MSVWKEKMNWELAQVSLSSDGDLSPAEAARVGEQVAELAQRYRRMSGQFNILAYFARIVGSKRAFFRDI